MGADLYIQKLFNPNREKYRPLIDAAVYVRDVTANTESQKKKAQEKIDTYWNKMYAQGYFRDAYNDGSFFWRLGLSWWHDVIPMLNKKSELTVTKAKKLRYMVTSREIKPITREELVKNYPHQEAEFTEEQVANVNKGFHDRRDAFVAFLDTAIKKKLPIYCSL